MKIAESKKDRFKGQLSKGLPKFFLYALLIIIAYVFIYPLMLMFATSLKSLYDQIDPLVIWLPKNIYWENYRRAWVALGGTDTYLMSIFNIGIIALVQTVSAAIIAYGIAKFDYWWTKLAFFIIVITFIFPQELFFLPQYIIMSRSNLLGTIWPSILLSAFGHGTRNAIYIFVFYAFFRLQPKALDEAAYIDGAGYMRTFAGINLPMAKGAIVVSYILSFVWNWNDTKINGQFFMGKVTTVQIKLQQFNALYERFFPYDMTQSASTDRLNYGVEMAGAVLAIIPLLVAYFIVQRFIVEGIEQSGITGE